MGGAGGVCEVLQKSSPPKNNDSTKMGTKDDEVMAGTSVVTMLPRSLTLSLPPSVPPLLPDLFQL